MLRLLALALALPLWAGTGPISGAAPAPALVCTPGPGCVPLAAPAPPTEIDCDDAATCGPRGAQLIRGPRGGCYYIQPSGRRRYVDRTCCR